MEKQSQFKPNLSQNKANSNPICQKAKIDAKCVFTKDYEEKRGYGQKKNKPNSNPICRRIKNAEFTLDVSSLAFLSGDIRISSLCYINSTNSYVRIYKQIMQNKANVK